MTRPAREIEAPAPAVDDELVELQWSPAVDPRRLRRLAELLADVLDNRSTPDDAGKP